MAAGPSIDVTGWLEEQLAQASPDLLRSMVQTFAEALMGAEADAVCGAGYGERSDQRANTRNGYRRREWDTRAGSIDLAIPKHAAPSSHTTPKDVTWGELALRLRIPCDIVDVVPAWAPQSLAQRIVRRARGSSRPAVGGHARRSASSAS
jgi:hypothetical protein